MINIKSNVINHNVRVLYQIKRTGGRGGSLRIQWQLQCSSYMLAYCVFNASSDAVSLKQPLTVKLLKTRASAALTPAMKPSVTLWLFPLLHNVTNYRNKNLQFKMVCKDDFSYIIQLHCVSKMAIVLFF